ncbi:hypothetical protein APHAL10511_005875 [Amanita phalloides]|nr:hypothetical protein APHAL10511_005875 [Amanita phalloides]
MDGGGKDDAARIWAPFVNSNLFSLAFAKDMLEVWGPLRFSRNLDEPDRMSRFMFTGSQDRAITMWDFSNVLVSPFSGEKIELVRCKSLTTTIAHDKDINSLDISPNERLLASGSQDRTIKIFKITYVTSSGKNATCGEQLVGTCRDASARWIINEDKPRKTTEEQEAEKDAKRAELALKEQEFLNYISLHDFKRAIELALPLEQPGRLHSFFRDIKASAVENPEFGWF